MCLYKFRALKINETLSGSDNIIYIYYLKNNNNQKYYAKICKLQFFSHTFSQTQIKTNW